MSQELKKRGTRDRACWGSTNTAVNLKTSDQPGCLDRAFCWHHRAQHCFAMQRPYTYVRAAVRWRGNCEAIALAPLAVPPCAQDRAAPAAIPRPRGAVLLILNV